jgi:ADP-ribose pyrophosphatase YjhB (NUDIX family)
MKKYEKSNSAIQVLSRALLFQGDNIILCRAKRNDERNWYFLPGGHVETGESLKTALLRELEEEIGPGSYEIKNLIGVCESTFILKEDTWQQEINFIFEAEAPADFKADSQEDHLEFVSVNKSNFKDYNVLPEKLKGKILNWLNDKKPFFADLD